MAISKVRREIRISRMERYLLRITDGCDLFRFGISPYLSRVALRPLANKPAPLPHGCACQIDSRMAKSPLRGSTIMARCPVRRHTLDAVKADPPHATIAKGVDPSPSGFPAVYLSATAIPSWAVLTEAQFRPHRHGVSARSKQLVTLHVLTATFVAMVRKSAVTLRLVLMKNGCCSSARISAYIRNPANTSRTNPISPFLLKSKKWRYCYLLP